MARTTTDDCLKHCRNHFSLTYHAARRGQEIFRRGDAMVPEGGDKCVVLALREVAKGLQTVPLMGPEKPPAPNK